MWLGSPLWTVERCADICRAMIAAGLERQLGRCDFSAVPDFCSDSALYSKIKSAYNHLWDLIEENTAHLSTEVWSWSYENGAFQFLDYGKVSPTGKLFPGDECTPS